MSAGQLVMRYQSRNNRVDTTRPPLVLEENGKLLKIFLHADVPMRNHFISHVAGSLNCPDSSMRPTSEQRGFIYHRQDRKVLCGYWAQECLRVEGVAELGFWYLSAWDTVDLPFRPSPAQAAVEPAVEVDSAQTAVDDAPGPSRPSRGNARPQRPDPGGEDVVDSAAASSASAASDNIPTDRALRRGRRIIGPQQEASSAQRTKTKPRKRRGISDSGSPAVTVAPAASSNASAQPTRIPSPPRPMPRASSPPRRTQPLLCFKSQEDLLEVWSYFLGYFRSQLGTDAVPPDVQIGTVDTVKQWMIVRVHEMWCEARRKYNRRNLDHLSIMLSTWKTSRDYNLFPYALRKFYEDFKGPILTRKGIYIPVGSRPEKWPFHERDPVNVEAGIKWIPTWEDQKLSAKSEEVKKERDQEQDQAVPTGNDEPAGRPIPALESVDVGGAEEDVKVPIQVMEKIGMAKVQNEADEIEDDLISWDSLNSD